MLTQAVIGWIALMGTVLTTSDARLSIVPAPAMVEPAEGGFELSAACGIVVAPKNPAGTKVAEHLQTYLRSAGVSVKVVAEAKPTGDGDIVLQVDADAASRGGASLGEEGYALTITPTEVRLQAAQPAGLFRGVQTLRQMLANGAGPLTLPCVKIVDQPRYRWRGMLLDCCRHFMDKEFVKRYIDLLAYHKMNVLHWHLTEDQGWRIEIKKYPKLTEIGAWRDQDGKRYGGFYTQEDVREIVAYAAERYITVVPEIEMPGHSRAALAAYPELACTKGPFTVANRGGIFEDVYCAGNDATFAFLEDVLAEVLELFPSEFIHVGGDECPKARWEKCPKCQARIEAEGLKDEHELQSYFIHRMERFLNNKGRRLIGWDEILEGGLAPNATVQSWRGMQGAIDAARAGHDVIASPTSHCYLDYPHEENPAMPRWMRITSLKQSYTFEPTPAELTDAEAKFVLGGEGNLWTERVPQSRVDHQAFPRLCAIAESLWSPASRRNWDDFAGRMAAHYHRLDAMGVHYFIPAPRFTAAKSIGDEVQVELVNPFGRGEIRYTLDGSDPTAASTKYADPLRLSATTTVKARMMLANGNTSDIGSAVYRFADPSASAAPQPEKLKPGIEYKYYEGEWTELPDYAALTPAAKGTIEEFDLSMPHREEHFALLLTGYLAVPRDGVYAFFLNSDDGARLLIGDDLVVDHGGLHGPTELRGQIILRAGLYPLRVEYFQHRGAYKFALAYEGPEIERQPIPASALRHE